MNPGTIVGILGALSLAISACDTAGDLTDAGARVRFGGAAPENALCQELGIVYGSDGGLGESSEEKMRTAQNKIRNRAAAAGGNFVLLDLSASDRAIP